MNRDNSLLGLIMIGIGIGFVILNIILLEKGLELINPFYSLFAGLSSSIFFLLNIDASMKYLPFVIMYLPVIILGLYYLFKEQEVNDGVPDTNLYFEYRQWNYFWGWFFDGKKEIQNILNFYNSKGWKIVDFEWAKYFSHFGIFKTIFIFYITMITLGVLSYWGGFIAIFEGVEKNKENNEIDEKEIYEKYNFLEWKKKNPSKSVNDYYVEKK